MVIKNLKLGYGSCEVAHCEGDLAFAKAEFISIIGINGAGKSTLLKSLNDASLRHSGSIEVDMEDYDYLTTREKAKITSVVLTERSFSQFLKVREILELSRAPYTSYYGKLNEKDYEIITEVLIQFGLQSIETRTLGTLSDGQLQRVLIARSLVQDTPYILMDEPTSHLDINYKVDLLVKLKNYCHQKNKTIIYATHELQLALRLSDQIISIHNGIIKQEPTAEFVKGEQLKAMFPSENIAFDNGKIRFNF